MTRNHTLLAFGLALTTAACTLSAQAQVGDPGTLIKEKLVSQIKLTKTTAAHDDIVTAGDVVQLHKDGLMMCSADSTYAYSNIYNNGVLMGTYTNRMKDAAKSWLTGKFAGGSPDAASNGCASRKFVSGEKFWVTDIALHKDGIVVSTFSDPYNDIHYYGEIKFPLPKGPVPPVDDFVKTVSEVLTVVPSDDKGNQNDQAAGSAPAPASKQASASPATAPAPASTPAPAPMAAIPPPPPPTDAPPPTISIGQTKDQVVAGFGQPVRTAKLAGTKEIYFYKDMKVTFTNGKVSNVE